ncbi:DPF2 [Acanthosepion pharaonis]|uniref:DPF2 n=1 Tax=Acanthosepion pharaonis TaxID=158019 RepID=A0A812D783_ACAPH|nr:DPF2 [Sepia pharaonis]
MAAYRKCIVSEQFLKEAAEQTASLNTRLSIERKMRQPFLDSQTGVAQNHTMLWQQYINRCQGLSHGQLYSYPSKRWKKRKRAFFPTEVRIARAGDIETGEADMHQISAIENPAVRRGEADDDREDLKSENSKDKWYEEVENISEPPDVGETVDYHSDISDYEEIIRKKKKKGGGRGRRKADKESTPIDDKDKPYCCEACGARYKTRPGLAYHYTHFHNGMLDVDESCTPSPPAHKPPVGIALDSHFTKGPSPTAKTMDGKVAPNNYCDFCLGDSLENKKTRQPEGLVSCSDCGRSGHPSCLQFTPNMIISSCGLCGTSDNDDQLLFCDDCDRGYHMYCLTPQLSEPPEGSWSCHLCIEEFHGGKKPEGMQ